MSRLDARDRQLSVLAPLLHFLGDVACQGEIAAEMDQLKHIFSLPTFLALLLPDCVWPGKQTDCVFVLDFALPRPQV